MEEGMREEGRVKLFKERKKNKKKVDERKGRK